MPSTTFGQKVKKRSSKPGQVPCPCRCYCGARMTEGSESCYLCSQGHHHSCGRWCEPYRELNIPARSACHGGNR